MAQLDQGASANQSKDAKDLAGFGYKQELHRTLGLFSSFAAAFSYISPSTGIFTLFLSRPHHDRRRLHLELADRRARPVHRGTQLRRGLQPLPHRRIGLPVDEVPRGQEVRVVHGMDLHLRRHPDGHRRGRDLAVDRASRPSYNMGWNLDAAEPPRPDLGRGHHARGHHDPQHLQRETRVDHQQHGRLLRDRRDGDLRHRDAHRAPSPAHLGRDATAADCTSASARSSRRCS